MASGPLVSVLTPVYNGEEYLEECIQSVIRQTYTNWEYVIVDNLSTDGTPAIAQRFAAEDSRVRLVRASEFLDIYGNHNRALGEIAAESRYCKIVQADDWIYPECLERMVDVAERNPSVGVVGAFRLFDSQVQLDGLVPYWQEVIPGREALRSSVLGTVYDWFTGSPTSLMYRSDLVRDSPQFYDTRNWHADTDAAFRLLLDSDLGFVHQVLTFSRNNPGMLSSFTYRVYTFNALEGKMLIRYGPRVLSRGDYQTALRRWLRRYGSWLAKQWVKPYRHRQSEFSDYHVREIDTMLAEVGPDPFARGCLQALRRMVASLN
jgi:glycosyltransferase involved in cell wall biosynthesis